MRTTIGGQIFLSMWAEKLVKAIPKIKFLQWNTDGITYLLPRKDLPKAKAVGQEMTDITGLYIEDNMYNLMVIRDVNNYLSQYESGDVKLKGCFEIDKEFHKDPSMRIVPIALKEWFINKTPIEETIRNHEDIFDFCMRLKTNSLSTPYLKYLNDDKILVDKKLDRTTRYYISNNGGILYKDFGGGRISNVNIGYTATLFNTYQEKDISEYNINYKFYINEANKIRDAVDPRVKQLNLFEDGNI